MRARTRFLLDIALVIGLVAAYRPTWTGISLHQWLSIAIIAPLLLHLIVNWQWAVRILRTFVERLFSASRANFVVDSALLLATVTVMLSGFMVSPALVAPLGIRPTDPLVWHALHLWSANATIALFALHAALHWRWLLGTAKRLVQPPVPHRSRPGGACAATAGTGATRSHRQADAVNPRRSRVGSRAAAAAAERAAALRVVSVLAVTGALGLAVFAGVGAVTPLLASASQSHRVASAGTQVCPKTGCTASRCHGTSGESPETFYGLKPKTAKSHTTAVKKRAAGSAPRRTATARPTTARTPRVASNTAAKSGARGAASAKTAAHSTSSAPKVRVAAAVLVRRVAVKKRLFVCPQTGCSATSCHGAHHQSASSYYK